MRWSIALLVVACGCGSQQSPAGPTGPSGAPDGTRARLLMITTTAGFRHDAIGTAVVSVRNLATSTNEFTVAATEDLSVLAPATLAFYDVVMFALTSGELPLSVEQQAALLNFVREGRGFVGVHSASDTLYGWPEYGRLLGAYFREHPWTQQADVVVEDQSHPSTSGLGGRFSIREEFYTFSDNPRGRVQVLLRLDPPSVGTTGDFPLAWAHAFGAGRVYYNALGHFADTWTDPRFQRQLVGAIRWTAGR
jgi:type 1 glutamine amidotransferase